MKQLTNLWVNSSFSNEIIQNLVWANPYLRKLTVDSALEDYKNIIFELPPTENLEVLNFIGGGHLILNSNPSLTHLDLFCEVTTLLHKQPKVKYLQIRNMSRSKEYDDSLNCKVNSDFPNLEELHKRNLWTDIALNCALEGLNHKVKRTIFETSIGLRA